MQNRALCSPSFALLHPFCRWFACHGTWVSDDVDFLLHVLSEAGLESALKKVVGFRLALQSHTISGKNWFGDWFLLTLSSVGKDSNFKVQCDLVVTVATTKCIWCNTNTEVLG